ncbi:MAG TPA: hypothetical protein VMB20_13170 [Candidatus Acidoferrum sp.]|nr:hypothetical protein [Candidatus Acidoferrum sp.]
MVVPNAIYVIDMDDQGFTLPFGQAALITLITDKAFAQKPRLNGVPAASAPKQNLER